VGEFEVATGGGFWVAAGAARTLRKHLWGILNAVLLGVDNSHAESMNSRIKTVKTRARGFRNKQRFRNAIYFHLGGLQLYPEGINV
jgi:transposase